MLLNYHIGHLVLSFLVVFVLQASACKTNTTQNQPHQISNTQRTKNKTTDVVIQRHSRKLLMMGILMSETCWAHRKWNKIASDKKLVFHSSTITKMHGPINIIYIYMFVLYIHFISRLFPNIFLKTLFKNTLELIYSLICGKKTALTTQSCH